MFNFCLLYSKRSYLSSLFPKQILQDGKNYAILRGRKFSEHILKKERGMTDMKFDEKTLRYLKTLSRSYPNTQAVTTEIINLRAILNLPKGTEHYISDIHGEYQGLRHILRNASGSVRRKIDQALGDYVSTADRDALAALIYYPERKLRHLRHHGLLNAEWYTITLKQLIAICKITTSKYTRSKVRKMLPKDFEYIISELMTTGSKDFNKEEYFEQILHSIIETEAADSFIIAMCHLVQDSVIDRLHVVGDIYDRGDSPHLVMDELEKQRHIDIQWGNHDILWMGAAAGNLCCIANAVRICLRYNNYDFMEGGYGINMRPLSLFALETYADDPCALFMPKKGPQDAADPQNDEVIAKMHKAIAVIQFKIEGQTAKAHPEYRMEDRLLLDKLDLERGVVTLDGQEFPLLDTYFPTIDPKDPYALTPEEQKVLEGLQLSFPQLRKAPAACRLPVQEGLHVPLLQRLPDVPRLHPHGAGRQLYRDGDLRRQLPGPQPLRPLRGAGAPGPLLQGQGAAPARRGLHVVSLVRQQVAAVRQGQDGHL